jgi:hypothetical protein
MANTYKYFTSNDRIAIRTPLYESKTLLKTQFSASGEANLYTGSNNAFVSVYRTGSSNTASDLLFDITSGRSKLTSTGSGIDATQKLANYNEFAKVLFGTDYTGSIYNFDLDFDDNTTNTNPLNYSYFLDISRILAKDEIKKGSFGMRIMINSGTADEGKYIDLFDTSGSTKYKTDSPVGEYGALYLSGANGVQLATGISAPYSVPQGLIFYQAGAVVLNPFLFAQSGNNPPVSTSTTYFNSNSMGLLNSTASMDYDGVSTDKSIGYLFVSGSITGSAESLQRSILTMSFQSTTEVNSTIYFCRVFNNEFNYSSNPTYLSSSKIVVKSEDPLNPPVSYITTVGLYSDDNQLLAVAKLSEPIKKTPENELILRTRLDF